MDCRIDDTEFDCRLEGGGDGGRHTVVVDGTERDLRILSMTSDGIEFLLDSKYHKARYVDVSTARMELVIDGTPVTLDLHPGLDKIVYKNFGGGGTEGVQTALKSQIPGKVVSMDVQEGAGVVKGDQICTLESMKMQVGVKAHRDGTVKSIRIKPGDNVAKNDVIADIE